MATPSWVAIACLPCALGADDAGSAQFQQTLFRVWGARTEVNVSKLFFAACPEASAKGDKPRLGGSWVALWGLVHLFKMASE